MLIPIFNPIINNKKVWAFNDSRLPSLAYGFDARSLSYLWQDVSMSTAVASHGQTVAAWSDFSGNARHLTQATSGNRPTYQTSVVNSAIPGLLFDGVNDTLKKTSTPSLAQPLSIFTVIKHNSLVAGSFICDGYGTTAGRVRICMSSAYYRSLNAGSNLTSANLADTSPHFHSALFNGTQSEYYIDGALEVFGDAGTQPQEGLTVGGNRSQPSTASMGGHISLFLVYNGLVTEYQRKQIEATIASEFRF